MDINYKLVLDSAEFTQSVQAGLAQLQQFNNELNKTQSAANKTFSQSAMDSDKLALKMEEIVKINGEMLIEFQKLGAAIKGATSTAEIKQLNDEITKLKAQIDMLSSTVGGVGGGYSGGLVKQMLQMKDRLIELRVAGKQNTHEYIRLNEQYSKLRANTLAVERDSKKYITTNKQLIESVNDTSQVSALAGANVISFGQVLSDLPYGIRGVANNLQQMTATLVMLSIQAGGVVRAFRALTSAFMGPLGLIVVVQGALAALDWYANNVEKAEKKTDKAKEATDKYTESLAKEISQMQILFGVAESLLKSGENYAKLKETATEINKDYNLQLDEENLTLEDLHKAYTLVLDDIKNKIALEAASESLTNAIKGELLAQEAINKAKARQIEIDDQLNKLQPNGITLLQLAARGEEINKLKLEEEELQKKITALERNKEGHVKNQVIFYERALELAKKIRVENQEDADEKRIKADTSALKDIQDDFEDRNDAIKQLTNDMIKYVADGGDFMTFQGQLWIQNWVKGLQGEVPKQQELIKKTLKPIKDEGAIAEWLGVTDRDVEVMLKNIRIIGRELSNIFNEFNEAAQRNNKEVIKSLDDVISKTEEKIEAETELQQMGLANNLEAEQAYLAEQNRLREEAYERQKQLELQKLAIDSISQLSSLITAAAQIWQATSKAGVLSPVLAIAAISTMFGSFALSKVKAAQLVKSQESFEEGGVVEGRRHTQGGEKFFSSDGNHMVEIEQGEYVTNRNSTQKYMDLLEAINNDEIGSHNIHKLLEGTGVTLPTVDTEIFRKDLKKASIGGSNSTKQTQSDSENIGSDIKEIKKYVKGIAEKETIYNDGNKTIIKKGKKTTTIRRGN